MKSIANARSPAVLKSPSTAAGLGAFRELELKPGAPVALEIGCTCDPVINGYGAGQHEEGDAHYFAEPYCPLHGLKALAKARV